MFLYKFFFSLLAFAAETCASTEPWNTKRSEGKKIRTSPWNSDLVLGFDRLDILAVALSIKSLGIRRLLSDSHNSLAEKIYFLKTSDTGRTRNLPGGWWWSRGWRHQGSPHQPRGPRNQVRRESPSQPGWWTDPKASSKDYDPSTFSPAQVPSRPFSQPAMTLPSPSTNLTKWSYTCLDQSEWINFFFQILPWSLISLYIFVFVSVVHSNLMGSFPSLESKTVPSARKPLQMINSKQSCKVTNNGINSDNAKNDQK